MSAQPTIQTIPLDKLQLSKLNARKTYDDASLANLKASIAAEGLLQNLTVTPAKKGDKFDVVAGGRRLRAMQQLAKEGGLASNGLVLCRVVDGDLAMEASVAENTIREAMNPVDEIEAYAKLEKAGKPAADIAVRFGQTERHVKGMLQLSELSPVLLEALRTAEMTVAQAKAFTICDDHKRQEAVWDNVKDDQWDNEPDDIKRFLSEDETRADSGLGIFILEEYRAAGGQLREDLFGTDVYLVDKELAERLALEKLEARSTKERRKYAWAEARLSVPYSVTGKLQTVYSPTGETNKYSGVFVTLNHNGKIKIDGPYIRPGDQKRAEAGEEISANNLIDHKVNDEIPLKARERLLGVRAGILRNGLAGNVRFMLTALAAQMLVEVFDHDYGDFVNVSCSTGLGNPTASEGLNTTAWPVIEEVNAYYARIVGECGSRLAVQKWLLDKPESVTLEALAHCAAQCITAGTLDDDDYSAFMATTGVDFAANWHASPEWLATLPKPAVLRLVRENVGPEQAGALSGLKKQELAIRAAGMLGTTGYLPEELLAAIGKDGA